MIHGYAGGFRQPRGFYAALPQYRFAGRYPWRALFELEPFLRSRNYSRVVHVFPPRDQAVVGRAGSFEDQASIVPGSFLLMVTGDSQRTEGFRVQLIDGSTDEEIFESDITHPAIAGSPVGPFNQPAPFILPDGGRAFPEGGQIVVRLTNLSDNSGGNRLQLALFVAQPQNQMLAQRTLEGVRRK